MEPAVRAATRADIDELVDMRAEFTFEDSPNASSDARPEYEAECRLFLENALAGSRWQIWVAEQDERIVSHAFVALVDKVPRPVREHAAIGYLTNVYTRPAYRGQGIGSRVVQRAKAFARDAGVELLFVWPSEESLRFYERHGFAATGEPLVWEAFE